MVRAKLNYRTVIHMRENIRMESAMVKELTSKKTQYIYSFHSFFFFVHSKANGKTLPFSPPSRNFLPDKFAFMLSSARRGSPREGRRKYRYSQN